MGRVAKTIAGGVGVLTASFGLTGAESLEAARPMRGFEGVHKAIQLDIARAALAQFDEGFRGYTATLPPECREAIAPFLFGGPDYDVSDEDATAATKAACDGDQDALFNSRWLHDRTMQTMAIVLDLEYRPNFGG